MAKEKIVLIGGGGHCRSCIDVIESLHKYEIVGILDKPENVGKTVLDYKIIGTDQDIISLKSEVKNFLITLGQIESAEKRKLLFNLLKEIGATMPTILSPASYVSMHANIGDGTIVMHGAIVNAGVIIGNNCIINSRALIEHDSIIGNHCHVSTGAIINGGVKMGDETFFGSGSIVIQNIEIPANSFIKANNIVK